MAANASVLNDTTMPMAATISPQEAALQSLCKQILKSRLFRGIYEERRYVDDIKGYRDIVSLHKSEKDLNKLVKDIRDKLQMFYSHQNPNLWIGVTCGPLAGSAPKAAALDTFIWTEMEDLAFGQYWFSIKTLRFRDNEVIIRLKVVRSVDTEEMSEKWTKNTVTPSKTAITQTATESNGAAPNDNSKDVENSFIPLDKQVNLNDFAELFQQWWSSIKQTTYDFMSNDISKENLKGVLKFLALLLVSILSGALMAVKFLGQFTIRFMFELSRLTHVLTPIIIKIIEVFNKIVGGFYILLAMIWKDTVVNRSQPKHAALEYNRPMYKAIEYDVRMRRQESTSPIAKEYGKDN